MEKCKPINKILQSTNVCVGFSVYGNNLFLWDQQTKRKHWKSKNEWEENRKC